MFTKYVDTGPMLNVSNGYQQNSWIVKHNEESLKRI